MSDWPVISTAAAIECDKMASMHRPVSLPAYDVNGTLIAPQQCKDALTGAVVRVSFTLTH